MSIKSFIFTAELCIMAWAAIFFGSTAAECKQIFVDQNNAQSSDSNIGTETFPLKTIGAAINVVRPGDEIIVKAGIYRETVAPVVNGTKEAPITFRAMKGHKVIIKGSEIVTGWEKVSDILWKRKDWHFDSQQVFVNGFPLRQVGPVRNLDFISKKAGGRSYTECLYLIGDGVGDITREGSFYYDPEEKALYVNLPYETAQNPSWYEIEASVRPLLFEPHTPENKLQWWIIEGFIWMHSNISAQHGWPALFIQGENLVFRKNTVKFCDFGGVGCIGKNNRITDNIIEWCGNNGMQIIGEGHVAERNILRYNNYRKFFHDWHAGGLKATSCKDVIFRNNYVANNFGHAIWFDIECDNILIENNIVADAYGYFCGLFYEISNKGIIRNNSVYNANRGVWISGSNDTLVEKNTIIGCRQGIVVSGPNIGLEGEKYTAKNNKIQNNIVLNSHEASLGIIFAVGAENNASDRNVFWNQDGNFRAFDRWGPPNYLSLAEWNKARGQDLNSRFKALEKTIPSPEEAFAKWIRKHGKAFKEYPN